MSNAHGIPASYLKDHSEAKLKQQTKAYHSKPLDGTEPSDATNTDATAPGEGMCEIIWFEPISDSSLNDKVKYNFT